ncbi:MAG: HAD-IA family hydrolase, partial [Chloroflexota bacterium]|nr:HAD-IA family hydrolase [Chloroflexota bacterium]
MGGEIEVVLFDFGGVVVPLSGAEGMIEAGSRLGLDTALLHTMLYDGDLWRDVSTGKLTVDQFWKGVSTATGHEAELLQAILRDIWEPPRLDPAVISLVRVLRQHVRVAMLSNATTGLEEHLSRLGIADLFDPIINSARVGLRKPDQAVFQHALKILDVPAHAVLFV